MATLSIDNCVKRVNSLILGQAGSGFTTTVSDERFTTQELQFACIETESEVFRVLAESYHPLRVDFLNWTSDLNHGDTIPKHFGNIEAIQIKPFTDSPIYKKGREVLSAEEIQDWRDNVEQVFGTLDHDMEGSLLACHYFLENMTVYFTGAALRAKICNYIPDFTTPTLQLDSTLEPLIVAGATSKVLKDGSSEQTAGYYSQQYLAMINNLRLGMRIVPEAQDMRRAGG